MLITGALLAAGPLRRPSRRAALRCDQRASRTFLQAHFHSQLRTVLRVASFPHWASTVARRSSKAGGTQKIFSAVCSSRSSGASSRLKGHRSFIAIVSQDCCTPVVSQSRDSEIVTNVSSPSTSSWRTLSDSGTNMKNGARCCAQSLGRAHAANARTPGISSCTAWLRLRRRDHEPQRMFRRAVVRSSSRPSFDRSRTLRPPSMIAL